MPRSRRYDCHVILDAWRFEKMKVLLPLYVAETVEAPMQQEQLFSRLEFETQNKSVSSDFANCDTICRTPYADKVALRDVLTSLTRVPETCRTVIRKSWRRSREKSTERRITKLGTCLSIPLSAFLSLERRHECRSLCS